MSEDNMSLIDYLKSYSLMNEVDVLYSASSLFNFFFFFFFSFFEKYFFLF